MGICAKAARQPRVVAKSRAATRQNGGLRRRSRRLGRLRLDWGGKFKDINGVGSGTKDDGCFGRGISTKVRAKGRTIVSVIVSAGFVLSL